jgi:hypothetical protein
MVPPRVYYGAYPYLQLVLTRLGLRGRVEEIESENLLTGGKLYISINTYSGDDGDSIDMEAVAVRLTASVLVAIS